MPSVSEMLSLKTIRNGNEKNRIRKIYGMPITLRLPHPLLKDDACQRFASRCVIASTPSTRYRAKLRTPPRRAPAYRRGAQCWEPSLAIASHYPELRDRTMKHQSKHSL